MFYKCYDKIVFYCFFRFIILDVKFWGEDNILVIFYLKFFCLILLLKWLVSVCCNKVLMRSLCKF